MADDVARETAKIEISLVARIASLDSADLLHVAAARETGATFVIRDLKDFDDEPLRQLLDVDLVRP